MLDELACTCQAAGCEWQLDESDPTLVSRTPDGERRACECSRGAVTMAVHR